MKWEAKGVHRDTGVDSVVIIDADNEESASRRANRAGILVESIRAVDPNDSAVGVPAVAPIRQPTRVTTSPVAPPQMHVHPQVAAAYAPTAVQVNVFQPQKRGMSILGIIAIVFGAIALCGAWIPFVGLLTLPVALLGALLAFVGLLVSIIGRSSGVAAPIIGGMLCVLAIIVQIASTGSTSKAISAAVEESQRRANQTNQQVANAAPVVTPPAPASKTSAGKNSNAQAPADTASDATQWADASQVVKQGDIAVKVESVRVAKVAIIDMGSPNTSKDPQLQITLTIHNTNDTKKLQYESWRGRDVSFSHDFATATDDLKNSYKRITFGFASKIVGACDAQESIYPGKSVKDVLVFEVPVDKASAILLELPAKNFDGEGMLRFRIPKAMIQRSQE